MKNKTVKVLQVFGSLNMGGAESRMMDIYRNIDHNICQFDFITMKSENQFYADEIISLGGNIFKIDAPRIFGIIKHIISLYKIVKNGEYSAVHAHTSYHCGIVLMVAFFAGVSVRISHARTTGSMKKNMLKGMTLLFGRCLVNIFSTHKFAISQDAGKFLFGKSKFQVIPNAIDIKKYLGVTREEILSLKTELNISENKTVIGQIGRFDPMKNHKFTIKWFAEFLKERPESVLVLVGGGPLCSKIENLIIEYGIKDNVIFTGIRQDVPKLIHIFDVLVFPSIFEGLGGVVLEAQVANVPAVVSDSIPQEADVGLGMVTRCSLESSFCEWNNAVLNALSKTKLDNEAILCAFEKKGYSLSAVSEMFINVYRGFR